MTPRERILAIGVGATIGLLGLQYGVSTQLSKIKAKQNQIDVAQAAVNKLKDQIDLGERLQRRVKAIKAKSLPTSEELLSGRYAEWLNSLAEDVGMTGNKVTNPVPARQVKSTKKVAPFTSYKFTMQGQCRIDQLLSLMAKYYDKDLLHSITSLKITRTDQHDLVNVSFDSQVIALRVADAKQEFSTASSNRLEKPAEEYLASIIGHNPFNPPNLPPKLTTSARQELNRNEQWSLKLEGADPELHKVKFELVSKELPAGLKFSERSGEFSGTLSENGSYEVLVRATDNGLPARSSEHKLALKVVDPPVKPVEVEKPKFDPAEQSRVTAMVGGVNGPQVWVRSLTDGKSFQLSEGDDFEVGTIKAKVVSINLKESFAEFETEGIRWIVGMDSMLKESFEKSKVN